MSALRRASRRRCRRPIWRAPDSAHVPAEVEWEPVVPEQSPLTPVFDEATRQRTAEIIARYPQSRSALLPLLHLVQSVEGYVSQDGIRYCAEVLELTTAEVSAVATFYTMYKRTPCGEHLVSVCTNTLCAALGGDDIYRTLSRTARGGPRGDRRRAGTPGSITLEHAECLAACDLRPGAAGQLRVLRQPDRRVGPGAGRGAAARRAAAADPRRRAHGPQDRRAGAGRDLPGPRRGRAGNSAATETLRGAQLAAERHWVAPAMPDTPPALPDLPERVKR